MSNLDSWEDDADAKELNQQAQQMNLNGQGHQQQPPRRFQPGASSFQPGAASFTPGQQFQQYGQYNRGYGQQYGQHNQYNQGQYGAHPQYGQQYGQQEYGQQGYYNQGNMGQQYQQPQQQQAYAPPQQRQAPPVIAKRLQAGQESDPPTPTTTTTDSSESRDITSAPAPKAKVLTIGGDTKPKAKVFSIGNTTPAPAAKEEDKKQDTDKSAPEAGAKIVAAKAIEKSESAAASGKTSPSPSSGKSSPGPGDKAKTAQRQADAVEKEQAEDVDTEILEEVYGKEHVNIIFIGHVDAGKSTLGGALLYATGMVDERTMDKYKREAKEAGRETWYLSWALDLTKEERAKGKTVEVGRGFFETEKRRYSILDAPGHKTFVPNMIGGASQADIGILVISARKGEYETGFEKGGQTREHAILAKTQGVNKLVVVVNKMDDPTVEWSQDRFKECTEKLGAFLKGLGYAKSDLFYMPISAQTSQGIKDRIPDGVCPWYDGPSVLGYLDNLQALERKVNAPFMMPISGKYRDLGTMIEGKIEAGVIKKDQKYAMMPNKEEISIAALYGETEEEIQQATCGEQIRVRIRGVEEEDILPGFVLCAPKRLVHCVTAFEAQIVLLELKSILTAGFNCVMHVHSAIEEVQFDALLHKLEKGTGRKSKKPPPFASRGMSIIARLRVLGASAVCIEKFEDYAQMGRFTLRDQGQTIAIGKVTKLITE